MAAGAGAYSSPGGRRPTALYGQGLQSRGAQRGAGWSARLRGAWPSDTAVRAYGRQQRAFLGDVVTGARRDDREATEPLRARHGGWGERARATGWGSRWAGHGPAETMRLAAPDLLTAPWHRGGRRGRRRAVCDIVCVIVLRCGEDAAACNAVGQSTRARDSDEFRSSQRTTEGERTLGETPDMRGGRRGCRWMCRWRWGWLRGRG